MLYGKVRYARNQAHMYIFVSSQYNLIFILYLSKHIHMRQETRQAFAARFNSSYCLKLVLRLLIERSKTIY